MSKIFVPVIAFELLIKDSPKRGHLLNCMIVRIWEVKCYVRTETFTEVVTSVASMVATPLIAITFF